MTFEVNSTPPIETMEIDDADWLTRKAYLNFTERDAQLLESLHEQLVTTTDSFVADFYAHLAKFPQLKALLGDEHAAKRLRRIQAMYFDSLTAGAYEKGYLSDRLHIGVTHQRIGLEPKWYLGAYCHYLNVLRPVVFRMYADNSALASDTFGALTKIVFLDLTLSMDTYIFAHTRSLRKLKDYAESIITAVPVALIVVDLAHSIVSMNRFGGDMFAVDETKIVGSPLSDLIASQELAQYVANTLIDGEAHMDVSVRLSDENGVRSFLVSITPIANRSARVVEAEAGALLTIEDISHRV